MGVAVQPIATAPKRVVGWVWALLVANSVIILTGGLVRLTSSGLGCPTWPRCTDESFVPHSELGVHGAIEFGNRLLTAVLIAIAIAATVAVWRHYGPRSWPTRLAIALAIGIPLQGVIGGITVLTHLNPWVVALHLILSLILVSGSTVLLVAVRGQIASFSDPGLLAWAVFVLLWIVVYLGTIVTGSGPHAGDIKAPRNGLDPQTWSHVHAAGVYALIAVTALAIWRARTPQVRKAFAVLLVAEFAQGLIGFVQYLNDLPITLVASHLVGAAVLIGLGTWCVLVSAQTGPVMARVPSASGSRAISTNPHRS